MAPQTRLLPHEPFVGRRREIGLLRRALDLAIEGRGWTIALAGEAGIGKTRTATELAALAAEAGCEVLWGTCHEGSGAPAYWPWIQLVRAFVHSRGTREAREALGPRASIISEAIPHVAEHLGDLPRAPRMADPLSARFRFHDAVATVFSDASDRRPLVLVLDDLHWADESSVLLLGFLARELPQMRALVLGTYRDAEVARDHPLYRCLGDLHRERNFEHLGLLGLEEDEVARLVRDVLGRRVTKEVVAGIRERTDGNPLYVTRMAREIDIDRDGSVPAGVRELVSRRLGRLPGECREVLMIVALVGREIDAALLAEVTGQSRESLDETLEAAVSLGVLERTDSTSRPLRFDHALTQEAIREELSPTARQETHARIADAIARLHGEDGGEYAAQLAEHCELAGDRMESTRLVSALKSAGQRCLEQYAFAQAREYFDKAIAARGGAPMDEEGADLFFGLARARCSEGDLDESIHLFEAAYSGFVAAGLTDNAAAVIAYPVCSCGRAAVGRVLRAGCERALELVEGGSVEEGRILAKLGVEMFFETGESEEATVRFQRALEIAGRHEGADLEMRTLSNWAFVDLYSLRQADAREKAERAYDLARNLGDLHMQVIVLWVREQVISHAWPGPGELEAAARELLDAAERLGDRGWLRGALPGSPLPSTRVSPCTKRAARIRSWSRRPGSS